MTLLSRQLDVVTLLIGMIIVLGISNTLTMSVMERTGEIGTIMAMGTPRRGSVLQLFVLQGLSARRDRRNRRAGRSGTACLRSFRYFGIPMPPPPGRDTGYSAEIMLTAGSCSGVRLSPIVPATLASIYPAWKASRLPIVDALRHNR